ncbi:MAG: right-handed parallel beta-helix repeat-containing protein [Bacteroidetes bacterium]|nr:right-handed parallel beta-helix repeat-containing protein [Bacteroidota bacterium]
MTRFQLIKFYTVRFSFLFLSVIYFLLSACSKNSPELSGKNNDSDMMVSENEMMNATASLRGPVLNVKKTGAIGDGITDDTKAIQKAIDSLSAIGGGTVKVPKGIYAINAKIGLQMKSKVDLYMPDSNSVLKAIPNDTTIYTVLMIADASDVRIIGGKILGERYQHTGTRGEWGMGIGVHGSSNISITNVVIADCWGDGIYISDNASKTRASSFVSLKNVTSRNNRRQGMSIIKATAIYVANCKFIYTNGTSPQAGIDIEPNYDTASYISIINSECAYNMGAGIQTYELKNPQTVITNINVHKNYLHDNKTWGGRISGGRYVRFTNNLIVDNKYSPMVYAIDTVNCILEPNQDH